MADPAPSLSITVETIADPERWSQVAPRCDALLDGREPGAIFRSSAWLAPWWRSFGAGRQLRVLIVARGGRLLGALPAYAEHTPFGGERLRLVGDGAIASDHLGTIAAPADRQFVASVLAAHLVTVERDLAFDHLTVDDPLIDALARAAASCGARLDRLRTLRCPFIALDGNFGAYLAARPNGAGKQLQRRRRWLSRRPGFAIEVATHPDEIAPALEQLFRLHAERWSGGGALGDPRAIRFHRHAATALAARGLARIYLLHADGAVRAALYGFGCGGRFAYYQSGHERAWRPRSVGSVLLAAVIEDCFARGLDELDLLCGDEPYKATFATGARELLSLRLARGPRARLLRSVERASEESRRFVRQHLPPRARDWLARRRGG